MVAAKKPRVVIIGAGMAGISAAFRLQQAQPSSFHLVLLEASRSIGGRICTSQFGGDRVELGATWIHGVEGSPVYRIAESIGALEGDIPWERLDGFPREPVFRAEGGLAVDSAIVQPVTDLYKKMMLEIIKGEIKKDGDIQQAQSIGTFLRHGFASFVSQQALVSDIEGRFPQRNDFSSDQFLRPKTSAWTLLSLQDAVFSTQEYMERVTTSANSLCDLDLESEQEYKEYPGDQITIGKGYISVLNELASSLPANTIQFGKKVQKLVWNRSRVSNAPVLIHCSDGSLIEADHVIVTVSLGVLKAATSPARNEKDSPWADRLGRPFCRSILDLKLRIPVEETTDALFEPPLPPCKVEAISRLGYGVVDKLFLLLDPSKKDQLRSHIQLMYKKDGFGKQGSCCPRWMRKTSSIAPIYEGSDVLLLWFAGDEALELEGLSDEEIISGVEETLATFGVVEKATGKEVNEDGSSSCSDSEESSDDGEETQAGGGMFCGVLRSRWGRDPLYQGSYSFVATGSSGVDIETVAEPLHGDEAPLQLLFAGEATDRHFYSTTHGAYLTGLREANRLLRYYSFLTDVDVQPVS